MISTQPETVATKRAFPFASDDNIYLADKASTPIFVGEHCYPWVGEVDTLDGRSIEKTSSCPQ